MSAINLYTQDEMLEIFRPLLEKEENVYIKTLIVTARLVKTLETICTITASGEETYNIANIGDIIIQSIGKFKESYVISYTNFKNNYHTDNKSLTSNWQSYKPKNKVYAIEITSDTLSSLNLKDKLYFTPSWGTKMLLLKNDFLVLPMNKEEIYRIDRFSFLESYKLVESKK